MQTQKNAAEKVIPAAGKSQAANANLKGKGGTVGANLLGGGGAGAALGNAAIIAALARAGLSGNNAGPIAQILAGSGHQRPRGDRGGNRRGSR